MIDWSVRAGLRLLRSWTGPPSSSRHVSR